MSTSEVKANGWTAVPVSARAIVNSVTKLQDSPSYTIEDITFPSSDKLVTEAQAFVKARLGPEAYNHSMRVFYWGEFSSAEKNATYDRILTWDSIRHHHR
jgi:cyanamide hydratase